jgi:hypothetical protein
MNQIHTTTTPNHSSVLVCVKVLPSDIPRFFPLLQSGIFLRCCTGISLLSFLKEVLLLSDTYIEDRISTIFLNGKPVDDLETAVVLDGNTVALSSAMPGLVGATMRRKGFYAGLRSTISHVSGESEVTAGAGSVYLKLFNLIMADIGPDLLKKGVFLPSGDLKAFFSTQHDNFFSRVLEVEIDGYTADPSRLKANNDVMGSGLVELRACT